MADMKAKLAALTSAAPGVTTGETWRKKLEQMAEARQRGEYEVAKCLEGEIIGSEEDGFFLLRQEFPLDHAHGIMPLGAVLETQGKEIAFAARDDGLETFDPRTTFFVDTESTGLMGGAGTTLFLIGAAYFADDKLRLDQCFMRDFDDEEPMLEFLREVFRGCETLVSYNGKSFDLPLLRTRFIQNRIPFALDSVAHYDLLHAVRRVYKRRLQNCSLTNIERNVLGLTRTGDVDSALIPRLWLDYLRTRDARPLKPVFYHHAMDILSLVTLTAWVAKCMAEPGGNGFEHVQDKLSYARLKHKEKRWEELLALTRQLLEAGAIERNELYETLCLQAEAFKRLNDFPAMAETWEYARREFPRAPEPPLELAKYYEHRAKDIPRAKQITEETLSALKTRQALSNNDLLCAQEITAYEHRLARLSKKLGRHTTHSLVDFDSGTQ